MDKVKIYGFYALAAVGGLAVVVILVIVFVRLIPAQRASNTSYYGTSGGAYAPMAPTMQSVGDSILGTLGKSLSYESSRSGSAPATSPSPASTASEGELTQRKIVKNASLSLLVRKAEDAASAIAALAEKSGGFVQNSQIYEVSDGVKAGTVTFRVPADKFSEAISEVKKLAVKVQSEQTNASDVTEQFVDIEARLKNLQAQETQYLEILKTAKTVKDTLDVTQYLMSVRGQIEQLQGQLKYLSRQVDMSTISVSLTAEAEVQVFGIQWRPLTVLKQALKSMLSGLVNFIDALIGFVFGLPVYLARIALTAAVAVFGWKLLRWIWKKFIKSGTTLGS